MQVRKAYVTYPGISKPKRVLVQIKDGKPLTVFMRGSGWQVYRYVQSFATITMLPGPPIEKPLWSWSEWYEKNWQDETWAWCYMRQPKNPVCLPGSSRI
jgi:hypothetical protein